MIRVCLSTSGRVRKKAIVGMQPARSTKGDDEFVVQPKEKRPRRIRNTCKGVLANMSFDGLLTWCKGAEKETRDTQARR